MSTPPFPLLAELLRYELEANTVMPADVAARVFPRPRRGRDRYAADRAELADQLARLVGPKSHTDDRVISPRVALALDRVLGLPKGFLLLVGALDDAIHATRVDARFLGRVEPLDRRESSTSSYVVVLQLGHGRDRAFVDGRFPPGSSSFPAEP